MLIQPLLHPWVNDQNLGIVHSSLCSGLIVTNDFNFAHFFGTVDNYGYSLADGDRCYHIAPDGKLLTYSDYGVALAVNKDLIGSGSMDVFGVADNIQQVVQVLEKAIRYPDQLLTVVCTFVFKSNTEPEGGWRWEKWGKYIGVKNPKCDYLYDEPEIEHVVVYHVYNIPDRYRTDQVATYEQALAAAIAFDLANNIAV